MQGKINLTSIRSLRGWLWDTALVGFGARKQLQGTFFYVRYRVDGRQHVRSIGRFGPLTPDQARLRARAILLNPAAPPEGDSFSVMVERYLAQRRQRLRISTLVEMERHLRKHSAALARLKLEAITRRDIAGVLAQHPGIVRNRIRGSLLAMFNWAIREGLIERNPVAGTGKLEERARERVLSEAEIRQLWHALPSATMGESSSFWF